ncbi:hypothetical protein Fleli_1049 [Bernardetia litoralis DSM 6794]|uniref:DUF2490 domain-containing protein n=1 Tax=Bernardetia litoralis (strain ATCC 23117 / DSM 6794 / NBRC 15988 / NCIMB 1366 / Fx l1 / Sio-4) TaxID=880071 RepID=I4AHQ9_BERLS|nr:hypothetical protein [Bernardetia litoralis]AFM03494.1 hypothetical protein Fleli_1049 [Bernardetia litoralis DSM 6794]
MKLHFSLFLIFSGLFLCHNLYSQNDYPKEKIRLKNDIGFGLNAQISLNKFNKNTNLDSNFVSKNIFLIQFSGKHSTMELTNKDYFYQKNIYLSYERLLSKKWIGGASFRYSEININTTTLRGHLRHYSPIKKLDFTFWQQVAFERILSDNSFYDPISRLRFQFAVNKYFTISKNNPNRKLIGTLSFEVFKNIQKLEQNSERRFFQEQRLQTEWFFPVHKNIYLGAFAGFYTKQFIALAQFNIDGEEIKPTRNLNQQTPTFGINAILTFGKNNIPNRRLWTE